MLALLAATAVAYLPGLHGPFLFDDTSSITDNPALHLASFSLHDLMRAAFSSQAGLLYRPISMLTFALNYTLFGDATFSFKLTNVIIHLINALLILWLTYRLLLNCRKRYRFAWSDHALTWAAVIIAGAWALHPLNLTAVLYVVQRMTSLAALFTLAGMLAYVYGRERMQAGRTGWPLVWLLTPLFGILGVLSKEDAALMPLFLLIIEWLLFGFRNREQHTSRNIVTFYLVGLILPGLIGMAYLVHHQFWLGYAGRTFTLPERVLTEFRVVFLYVKWTFFPDIRELSLYHDDIVVSTGLLHPVTTLLSLLALLALLALAFWQRHKRPLLCLGILFFFAGQMMESTVLPLLIAFEHRNYLPDYGLLLAFFSLLLLPAEAMQKPKVRPALRWTLAIIILPVLFTATWVRSGEWANFLSFSYYEALHHPHSEEALYSLGHAYADLAMAGQLKNPQVALQALSHAAARSQNIMPDVAMMIVGAKLGEPVKPAWEQRARKLLLTHPLSVMDVSSLSNLVTCLAKQCRALAPTTLALIQTAFQSARLHHRSNADLWVIYGNYLTFTGHSLKEINAAMLKAVKLKPSEPQYQINVADAYIAMHDFPAAEARIQALSRLNRFGSQDLTIKQLKQKLADARAAVSKQKTQLKPHRSGSSLQTGKSQHDA